jgi:hypothetical protein
MSHSSKSEESGTKTIRVEYRAHQIILYPSNDLRGLWMAVIQPPGTGPSFIDLPKAHSREDVLQQAREIIDRRIGSAV